MQASVKIAYFEKYHSNCKYLENGIKLIDNELKTKIISSEIEPIRQLKEKLDFEIGILNRIQMGNIISWSESIIKRLLFEPNAFEEEQIELIINQRSLEGKWRLCLRQAFIKAFNLGTYNSANPNYDGIHINSLSPITSTLVSKYNHVKNSISIDLVPNIDLRNKIQHGEWENAFKKPEPLSGLGTIPLYNVNLSNQLNSLNILLLKNKVNNLKALYKLIKDLATFKKYGQFKLDHSSNPFEYFFNQNLDRINQNRRLASEIDYQLYKSNMKNKYLKELTYRT